MLKITWFWWNSIYEDIWNRWLRIWGVYFQKRDTSNRFETLYTYVFWLSDYKYDHENWCKWHFKVKTPKKPYFSYYLDEYWFEKTVSNKTCGL